MLKGDTGAKRTWFYENGAFVAAALAAVLWHVILSTNVGDDMVYFKTLLDGNSSLGEILAHRYETWSSRMVIEVVLIPLVHCPLLWKILDIVIFTSLPVLLCGLLGVTGRGRWVVTGLVLLYPFADMASAGWIATTTNYLWPLWGVLVIGMVLKQLRCGRKVPVWEVAAALLACAYAGSQEQAAVLLLLLLAAIIIRHEVILKKRNETFTQKDPSAAAACLFADCAALLAAMGLKRGTGSMLELCETAKEQLGEEYAAKLHDMTMYNAQALFSSRAISPEQLTEMRAFHDATLESLKTHTNWPKKLRLKWLNCLY